VIDRAIGSDQGLKYVYVIDAQNKAAYRRVTTGALQADGLRVITEGLKSGRMGGRGCAPANPAKHAGSDGEDDHADPGQPMADKK